MDATFHITATNGSDVSASVASPRPVFLLQGLGATVRVLRPLEARIRRLGRATLCPSPLLGLGDIRDVAVRLHDQIEESANSMPFERADIVGHSLGGLVAAYLLKRLDRGHRISRVIALGTPFRGLKSAQLGAWLLGPLAGSLRQMTPGSALLRQLAELPVPAGCALVSIEAANDWLVPPEATRLPATPGHLQLDAGPLDHFDLLLRKRCFDLVEQVLEAPCVTLAGAAERPARLRTPELAARADKRPLGVRTAA